MNDGALGDTHRADRCLLIINGKPLHERPVRKWLGPGPRLVMLTSSEVRTRATPGQLHAFDAVDIVDDYTHDPSVIDHAVALGRRNQVTRVVSCQEDDVVRAAQIRTTLGVTGQTLRSAVAYRDKLLMRQHARTAGIHQPNFAPVTTVADVHAFIDRHGMPVAIKPRLGAGSRDIIFIHTAQQLQALTPDALASDMCGGWLVESFVAAPLFHIDGITAHGRVIYSWPSRYATGNAESTRTGSPLISVMLAPGDPAREELARFADRVHGALPAPPHPTGFHLEAWLPAGSRPVLCEVAARPTGPPVAEMFHEAFGANLIAEHHRGLAGESLHLSNQPDRPDSPLGCVRLLRGHGTFTPPSPCPVPGVRLSITLPAGEHGCGPSHAADRAGHAIIAASSPTEVRERISDFLAWWIAAGPWRS